MKYTILNFLKDFPDDETCFKYIFEINKKPCICGKNAWKRTRGRLCYACPCGKQFYPLSKTIFTYSTTPLNLWFYAIYLNSQSSHGVSAKEIQRQTGVTYKCAWRMQRSIRNLMKQGSNVLSGIVEADETYVSGKGFKKHRKRRFAKTRGRGSDSKTPVFGVVERGGDVVAIATPNVKASTIMPLLCKYVKKDSRLMTDDFNIYSRAEEHFYHQSINHSEYKYVMGSVHTNTIEGFWSHLKRGLNGTYHSVSAKYLQSYIDERVWRYNRRHEETHPFHSLLEKSLCEVN